LLCFQPARPSVRRFMRNIRLSIVFAILYCNVGRPTMFPGRFLHPWPVEGPQQPAVQRHAAGSAALRLGQAAARGRSRNSSRPPHRGVGVSPLVDPMLGVASRAYAAPRTARPERRRALEVHRPMSRFSKSGLGQHRTGGGAHGARGSELSQMSGVPSGCCAFADAGVGTTMIRARKSSALGNSAADRSVARDADPRQSMTGEPGDLTGRVGFARQEGLISDYPVAVLSSWRMDSSASITSSRSTLDLVNRS
jgi:hypothetical protein